MRFPHNLDIYKKTVVKNAVGQKKPTWTFSKNIKCSFTPKSDSRSFRRASITQENSEDFNIFMPSIDLDIDDRLMNIKDRFGNIIYIGPFEIIEIWKQPGFSGKVHHLSITIREVIEQ